MEVDMKKVLPWVITCIYLIVYVWLMKTLSLWGLEYIVVFSFFFSFEIAMMFLLFIWLHPSDRLACL